MKECHFGKIPSISLLSKLFSWSPGQGWSTAPNLQGMQRPTKAVDARLLFGPGFSELLTFKFYPNLILEGSNFDSL